MWCTRSVQDYVRVDPAALSIWADFSDSGLDNLSVAYRPHCHRGRQRPEQQSENPDPSVQNHQKPATGRWFGTRGGGPVNHLWSVECRLPWINALSCHPASSVSPFVRLERPVNSFRDYLGFCPTRTGVSARPPVQVRPSEIMCLCMVDAACPPQGFWTGCSR